METPGAAEASGPARPWDPEVVVGAEAVQAALRDQFPGVDSVDLTHLGAGWEFDAWATADGWVFRVPRRKDAVRQLRRERPFLELVRPVLAPDVAVPWPELRGEPGPGLPWPFAGHRLVEGVPADQAGVGEHPDLPGQLARALGRLHSVPPGEARAAGVPENHEAMAEWADELRERFRELRELGGGLPEVREGVRWFGDGLASLPPPFEGPPCLVHNDLCPAHVLLDPETGALTGILDWTDTSLGDPALDFVFLATWRGWEMVEAVLEAYVPPLDSGFRRRLGRMARIFSLAWLQEALVREGEVEKHRLWVRNAFRGPEV